MESGSHRDKIIVQGIQFYGYHGVSDEEQTVGHRYALDLEMSADTRAAGRSDSIHDTINYAAAARLAVEVATAKRYRLLEALAEAIAAALLQQHAPEQVLVRVKKLLPPTNGIVEFVAVEIVRP